MNIAEIGVTSWLEQQGLVRKLNRHSLIILYSLQCIFIPRADHVMILPSPGESDGVHFLTMHEIENFFSDHIVRLYYANPEFFRIIESYIDNGIL